MRLVRWAAAAMNTSGEEIISQPALWCSPTHASSNPSLSSHSTSSRSRSIAKVGFSPTRWNGPRKMPNFIRSGNAISGPPPAGNAGLHFRSFSNGRGIRSPRIYGHFAPHGMSCQSTGCATRAHFLICHCEESPVIPSSSSDVAISMRLNTRRRTAAAKATELPRYARNDKVGTH